MLRLPLKEYLWVIEATNKSYGLMGRLYGFIIDALERLDVSSHSKMPSRPSPVMPSMKRLLLHSSGYTKRWRAVLASIDLELRTAESIRLLFEKVLEADCLAPVLRLMDDSCFIHDHQNSNAFLKEQQLKLKEGIGWIEKQIFKTLDEPQRQLLGCIQSSIDSIDTLLVANTTLTERVQALMQAASTQQHDSDGQAFQNLIQHCQRWSLPPTHQEGFLDVQAAFMSWVLRRLRPQSSVQGAAHRGWV